MNENTFGESEFIRKATSALPQLLWFLGAGASRTAGMPTATDIIWDLKRRYYCLSENQDLQALNINDKIVRTKIQSYMDSKGFPTAGCLEEYPFYFLLTFGDDLAEQQRYIAALLDPEKISLKHRALAAMLEAGLTRVVFSTNFDEVMERAFAFVTGKTLTAFHLEGSYGALDAFNVERFPLYAKIHGDFRFRSLKNLPSDLRRNDAEIQKCFHAAANRFGMIVSGYSGRDANVVEMFRSACAQANPFPHGLFWTTPRLLDVTQTVKDLIAFAQSKGVDACLVETGSFDTMVTRLWRHYTPKPAHFDAAIYTAKARPVAIPIPAPSRKYPIIRTNSLPILKLPSRCGSVTTQEPVTFAFLNEQRQTKQPNLVASLTDQTLFWGEVEEAAKLVSEKTFKDVQNYDFDDSLLSIRTSGIIKAFFEEALVKALCQNTPLVIRRRGRSWYAVVDHREGKSSAFGPLRLALGNRNTSLNGVVPQLADTYWAECTSLKLEEKNGLAWLLIRPDIWITPLSNRYHARDFLRDRKLRRWNAKAYHLLDSWLDVLVGSVGAGKDVEVSCFENTRYPANFTLNTRSGYSGAFNV